jgi:hypothetical protein
MRARCEYVEAESMVLAAIRESAGTGLPHGQVTSLRCDLAKSLSCQGRYAEAEHVAEHLPLPGGSTGTSKVLFALAIARCGLGRLDEAGCLLRPNAAAWTEHFGEQHPKTVAARDALAALGT